ncbi:MAG TPA: SAM-dependent methyltransferase [Deltaproteobacteria bacterium]|nr:SAM-dependent methyltransferase [Deltaproteobacteria bacterium]
MESAKPRTIAAGTETEAGMLQRTARALVFRDLERIREGTLSIVDGDSSRSFGEGNDLRARITVLSPTFYRDVAFWGSVGAGSSYMDGNWTADDLVSVVRILARNAQALEGMEGGAAVLLRPVLRLLHALRKNTETGSRRNIADHYDLGNRFYELFLDPTMSYSCAFFEHPDSSLEEATVAKFDRVLAKVDPRPGDHLLEIGCGWGGFAVHAARTKGCRVTAVTISREQHEYAVRTVREAGVSDRVEVLLEDYRRVRGSYDRIVSIEMIEAVGHHYLEEFFRRCASLLRPEGAMLLQAITIPDRLYRRHIRSVDFIKRYIFPGSFIPSVAALCGAAGRTDLRPVHLEDITPHYARTLREWRTRFLSRLPEIRAMGFPERFVRMWEFYLCYCEGSFAERYNGDAQILFAKPRWLPF